MARLAAGDSAQAITLASLGVYLHALDPGPHALLADLLLARDGVTDVAVMESYAACILAPTQPASWRRWGMISFVRDRNSEALAALERYFSLGGSAARDDEQAVRALAETKRRLPGGELAQEAVRSGPGSR